MLPSSNAVGGRGSFTAIWAIAAGSACGNVAKADAVQAGMLQDMAFPSLPFLHPSQFFPAAPISDPMAAFATMTLA